MRSFAILATIYAAVVGTTSALTEVKDRTTVAVDATGYDTRTSGAGCSPNGCRPANTRDRTRRAASRWSCLGDLLDSSAGNEGCCIMYSFREKQDLVKMSIAFYLGDTRTRTLNVYDNGNLNSEITSSGSTNGFEKFDLNTYETEELKLCLADPVSDSDLWLSFLEVKLFVK